MPQASPPCPGLFTSKQSMTRLHRALVLPTNKHLILSRFPPYARQESLLLVSSHPAFFSSPILRLLPLRTSLTVYITPPRMCIEAPTDLLVLPWLARLLHAVGNVNASSLAPSTLPSVFPFSLRSYSTLRSRGSCTNLLGATLGFFCFSCGSLSVLASWAFSIRDATPISLSRALVILIS